MSLESSADETLNKFQRLLGRNLNYMACSGCTNAAASYQLLLQQKTKAASNPLCSVKADRCYKRFIARQPALLRRQKLASCRNRSSQWVYKRLVGHEGYFLHKMAYIRESLRKGVRRWSLEISNFDGAEAQELVTAHEPLMSPAFSHDGKKIAYVSYAGHRSKVVVYNKLTGKTQVVASSGQQCPSLVTDGRTLT